MTPTGGDRRVSDPVFGWAPALEVEGWRLVHETDATLFDVPRRSEVVALAPDGRRFELNDPRTFVAFHDEVGAALEPVELAGLLCASQGEGEHVRLPQRLVRDPGEVGDLLRDAERHLVRAPEVDGATLRFYSTYVEPGPDRVLRAGVNRWEVEAPKPGSVSWRVEPVARQLPSPRYAPR